MDINTAIEIEAYGDFDMKYTECVMVSSENKDVNQIVKDYCSLRGLDSTKGLPSNMLNDTTNDFINYLKKLGFSKLNTKSVCFSD